MQSERMEGTANISYLRLQKKTSWFPSERGFNGATMVARDVPGCTGVHATKTMHHIE
jgi:hypothetical protein